MTDTHADEDQATRVNPHAPPLRKPARAGVSALVLAGSAALAIGGVGFGAWAWLGRSSAATVASPAAVVPIAVPAAIEPPSADPSEDSDPEPEIVDEVPVLGGEARESPRAKRKKPSRTPTTTSTTRPRPTTRRERPNDLFPPSD